MVKPFYMQRMKPDILVSCKIWYQHKNEIKFARFGASATV
jgi:hypothetical protein